jgi:hypothetical protein
MSGPHDAVLYSYDPVHPDAEERIARDSGLLGFRVLRRIEGKEDGPQAFGVAVAAAQEAGARVIVVPDPFSIGPMSPEKFLKTIVAPLKDAGRRLVALSDPQFDTDREGFLYGVTWATTTRARQMSTVASDWHKEKKDAGEHTGRPQGSRSHRPDCATCRHHAVRLGRPGHPIIDGVVQSQCYFPRCGCSTYVPVNEVFLGKAKPAGSK